MPILARIYIIRHGETEANKGYIIQGQTNTTLNDVGLEQAKNVGEKLKSIPFDIAFTSDLTRAVQTAEGILAHHPGVKLQKKEELRERFMGDLENKTYDPNMEDTSILLQNPTLEPQAIFEGRAENWWLKDIVDGTALLPSKSEPYHILVTTHAGLIGAMARRLIRSSRLSCAPGVAVGAYDACLNTSITIIELDDTKSALITQWADASHLKDAVKKCADVI